MPVPASSEVIRQKKQLIGYHWACHTKQSKKDRFTKWGKKYFMIHKICHLRRQNHGKKNCTMCTLVNIPSFLSSWEKIIWIFWRPHKIRYLHLLAWVCFPELFCLFPVVLSGLEPEDDQFIFFNNSWSAWLIAFT